MRNLLSVVVLLTALLTTTVYADAKSAYLGAIPYRDQDSAKATDPLFQNIVRKAIKKIRPACEEKNIRIDTRPAASGRAGRSDIIVSCPNNPQ